MLSRAMLRRRVTLRSICNESVETIPSPDSQPGAATGSDPEAIGVTLVVPVFDEAANVTPLMDEIDAALTGRERFEVIVVDDGSRDTTRDELAAASNRHAWLRPLAHAGRSGKAAALRTGVRAARGALIVTLDGDRQNDPADIPDLLDRFRRGREADAMLGLLAGQRERRRDTWLRRLSSRAANGIRARVLGDATRDSACGVKVFPPAVFLALPYFDGLHRFLPALVRAQGYAVVVAPVRDRPRAAGEAKYGFWNRAFVGLVDMLAVYWLIRRCHLPSHVTIVDGAVPAALEETGEDPR
mgnify:CR=1 FL=1